MPTLGRTRRQLASLLWKASVDEEVDAEFDFHVEMRIRELVAQGMDPTSARATAVARFGDIRAVRATCRSIGHQRERDMRRTEYLSELAYDAQFAVRQLLHAPAFTAVAVATLALGVGATTAIFSAVEAVVLRPFPYPAADQLAFAFTHWQFGDGGVSVGDYAEWRKRSTSFAELAAFQFRGVTMTTSDSPERITDAATTANTFPMYGVKPQLGRVFAADEDQPGKNRVAVLSDGLWRRAFAAKSDVVGQSIALGGIPHTIIGVMPPEFDPTDSHEDLWTPVGFTPAQLAEHDEHFLTVVGRLRPGVTLDAARREMDAIGHRLAVEFSKTNKTNTATVAGFAATIVGNYRTRLFVILAAVGCVLLIACGNVANLLLARGAARSKELAVRTAIGAGRSRIVRQLLTESLVLAAVSSLCGLLLAWAGIHLLVGAAPASIPRLAATRIDGTVLLFALAVTVACSIIFGSVPALRSVTADVQQALREGGRTAIAGTRDRVRTVLIVAEVAVALMLLVGGGLLIRSAMYLSRVDPGFKIAGLVSARVALRPSQFSNQPLVAEQSFARILDELRAAPGVASAALTSAAPLGPGGGSNGIVPEGRPSDISSAIDSRLRMVSPGYLTAMGIPLLSGRDIAASDVQGGLRVMVVSAALAKAAWPNESAIGKRVACCEGSPDDRRWKTIVGVAADVRTGGPTQDIRPEFYIPIVQSPPDAWRWINGTMTVVARAANGDGGSLTPAIRGAVRSVDPSLPVFNVATMNDRLQRSMAESRFHLMLLGTLGAVGLLLAAAGIYSVIAYFVALRTHEIGVRMALGAAPGDVVRLMTLQGLRPVIGCTVAGCVIAMWATRLLRGSLYGVTPTDRTTFAVVTLVLLVVAIIAILIPARRATAVDPTTALQGQ
jgi:putative ABC transport system permease protein